VEVTVRVHGALRAAALGFDLTLSLPEHASARDLFAELAARFGAPFSRVAASPDARLPRDVRLFVGSELVALRDAPLAAGEGAAPVTVVLLTPVSGG
jgi:hypothetical protein